MAPTDLLLPWLDVLGNLTVGSRLRGESAAQRTAAEKAARKLLARVGLSSYAAALPAALDRVRYDRFASFLTDQGLIRDVPPVESYAVELR